MANPKVTNLTITEQSGADQTVFASWTAPSSVSHLDHYTVQWKYSTGQGYSFVGQEEDTDEVVSVYSYPDNATSLTVRVTPVSETYTSNSTTVSYWTGETVLTTWSTGGPLPETPDTPTITMSDSGTALTASLDNVTDENSYYIEFQTVYVSGAKYVVFDDDLSKVDTDTYYVKHTVKNLASDQTYYVRARGVKKDKTTVGEWSGYSSAITTIPDGVTITSCRAESTTSVRLVWSSSSSATSYEVEYAVSKTYFDKSSETQTLTTEKAAAHVTGLDSGQEWFFRVRAVNDTGNSDWSEVVSIVLGSAPDAPTTWSSTSTAMIDDTVTLYWVHNSEDTSYARQSEIELTVNGSTSTITQTYDDYDSEDAENTHSYTLSLSGYSAGAVILWRVRTMGATEEYGPWSIQREIDVYAPATLLLYYDTTITALPFNIGCVAGPSTQTPVSYSLYIVANSSHQTTNSTGAVEYVTAGQTIFSQTTYTSESEFSFWLAYNNITLANGQTYTGTVTSAMDTGLTCEKTFTFTVSWETTDYFVNAEVGIDETTWSCQITPYALDSDGNYASDVYMSVYRREFDGSFTAIAVGMDNDQYTTVTDPHPALDYARYRIVAVNISTGYADYTDLPSIPVGCTSIVLQWDETWSTYETDGESSVVDVPWAGSMLILPWNIDTTEEHDIDVELVEYIGRSHPVSYYGTQLGETAVWNSDVDREDKETLYALRKLAIYRGDVYCRNPSGVGYWAHVQVSMTDTHLNLVVPVSLSLTRVEGGA